ncbi:MAG: hypothetical protein Q8P81_02785 [Nanoarchaeota archaeon]|nr:hypothetical protein [Nanoarchaeota archaeon]
MSVIRNILLVVLSFFLIILLFISATLLTANSLLYPDVYVEALKESGAYGFLSNATEEVQGGSFIEVPEGGLDVAVEDLLTNFLSYLRGDSEELNLTIGIDGNELRSFFEEQAEKVPVCNSGEEPYSGEGDSLCRPSDTNVSEFLDEALLRGNITLPEGGRVDLAEVYGFNNSEMLQVREHIQTYNTVTYIFFFLDIVLIILIFVVSKSMKKGVMVSGINLILAGTGILVASVIVASFVNIPNIEFALVSNIFLIVKDFIISKQNFYGILLLAVGGVLTVSSIFVRNNIQNQAKPLK